jgi:tricarballylate dehydrogenase
MQQVSPVIVVGGGNAGLTAGLAARENGAEVVVLERAQIAEAGGNTAFAVGAMRIVYHGLEDVLALVPDLTQEQIARTDFGAYDEAAYFDDMARVTMNRCDPDLTEVLVKGSFEAARWMTGQGVRFLPLYGRQAFEVDGRFTFWGGVTLEVSGGGRGLVEALTRTSQRKGIDVRYGARAVALLHDDHGIQGVRVREGGRVYELRGTVVLAAGGFQADAGWRARYLGPDWDLAKVRGSRFNTGDGIRMALEVGASPHGHLSGCHAVGLDRNAPDVGDLRIGDRFQKHSYPFGIMVNAEGRRFVDEGADFRNYTGGQNGRKILAQTGQVTWQVFDAKVLGLLREEYGGRGLARVRAESLEELAAGMDGVSTTGFLETVRTFNEAVRADIPFDPNVKDGRRTEGLAIDKTNWANTLTDPPFEAYAETCGVTFTYGGLRITPSAEVVDGEGAVIPGLYACGELVGGLFYHNYPGGAGLTAGSVFGRLAGAGAANDER